MDSKFTSHDVFVYNRCPLRFQLEQLKPSDFRILELPDNIDLFIDQYLVIETKAFDNPTTFKDLKEDQWYRNITIDTSELNVSFPRVMRHGHTIDAYVIVFAYYPRMDATSDIQCMYYAIKTSGYKLGQLQIIHLCEDYVYNGNFYYPSLMFETEDYLSDRGGNAWMPISEIVNTKWVEQRLSGMKQLINQPLVKPSKCIHSHFCPYRDECDYGKKKLGSSNEAYHWIVDQRRLGAWLNQLEYPLYFIDFEWTQRLLPWCKGQHLINDFVFEYALVRLEADGDITENVYITRGSTNKALFSSLIDRLGDTGSILAFNAKGAEIMQLRRFASWYPSYHEKVCKIISRMISIDVPLLSHMIYDETRKGAYGLKQISQEIGFDGYSTVDLHDGLSAVKVYRELLKQPTKSNKKSLEQYCLMDVRSMVKLLQWYYTQSK